MGDETRVVRDRCPSWCCGDHGASGSEAEAEGGWDEWHDGNALMFAAIVPESVRRRAYGTSLSEGDAPAAGGSSRDGALAGPGAVPGRVDSEPARASPPFGPGGEGKAEEFGITLTRRSGEASIWVVIASETQWIELSLESALRLSSVLRQELGGVRLVE